MQDQIMQDLKMKDQVSGHENVGPKIEGPNVSNYTCPPFFGPVSVVLHFQVLHFYALTFGPSISGPTDSQNYH